MLGTMVLELSSSFGLNTGQQKIFESRATSIFKSVENFCKNTRAVVDCLLESLKIHAEHQANLQQQLFGSSHEGMPALLPGIREFLEKAGRLVDPEEFAQSAGDVEIIGHRPLVLPGMEPKVRTPHRKKGRQPLPDNLECILLPIITVPEDQRTCPHCGVQMQPAGFEVTEEYAYSPGHLYKKVHRREKIACPNCQGADRAPGDTRPAMLVAPATPRILPHSAADTSLLTALIIYKYCLHLPLYRMEQFIALQGASLSRKSMSTWLMALFAKLKQWFDEYFLAQLRRSEVVNMDETTIQVLREENKTNQQESRLWVAIGGPDIRVVVFHYSPTRSGANVGIILGDSPAVKFLQSDGYKPYAKYCCIHDVVHVGCLVHLRRRFVEVVRSLHRNKAKADILKRSFAYHVLLKISQLYQTENVLRDKLNRDELTTEKFLADRKKAIQPMLNELFAYIAQTSTPHPVGLTNDAIDYALKHRDVICNYLKHPALTPDNNCSEREVKPAVIGRKNWLFAGSPTGARAAALYYSLIATAKGCKLNPSMYIRALLDRFPLARSREDFQALLPWNICLE